jgi:hypothetical protein
MAVLYRARYGYFPGDEHRASQSAGERRLNRIKATAFFGVIIPLLVAIVVCSTAPRSQSASSCGKLSIMWCAYSIEPGGSDSVPRTVFDH